MPAVSRRQRKIMGIALAIKRGETPASYSPEAAKIARSMTMKQLEDFAKKPKKKKGNPHPKKKDNPSHYNDHPARRMAKRISKKNKTVYSQSREHLDYQHM